jgi:hypothetical protein
VLGLEGRPEAVYGVRVPHFTAAPQHGSVLDLTRQRQQFVDAWYRVCHRDLPSV